jgi:hypothetical protein
MVRVHASELPRVLAPFLLGVSTTVINVLATQGGHLSVIAKVNIVATTVFCGSMLALIVVYNLLLNKIITKRDR